MSDMAASYGVVIGACVVCMLVSIYCALLLSLSLKLYMETMKEKEISSRINVEHECVCTHKVDVPLVLPSTPIVPCNEKVPKVPIKGIPLSEAKILAQEIIKQRIRRNNAS